MNVYSVFDAKAAAYLRPFFERNDATAVRSFKVACSSGDSFGASPGDFTLFRIASWDELSGRFESETANISVLNGLEALSSE